MQDVAFLGVRTCFSLALRTSLTSSAPQTDSFLFLTAHNTILHYITPPSSFPDPPASPELRRAIHPPLRPLLWCGAFSQTSYNALEEVKVAAGSMLGDVLSWSLAEAVINDGEEAILGDGVVTRLEGHQVRCSACRGASTTHELTRSHPRR